VPPLHIQVISSPDCKSIGDALREIDAKRLIHGEFILMWGDTVSNADLAGILDDFK
jgi:translation initiation factor eIF-2B subunit epsilon